MLGPVKTVPAAHPLAMKRFLSELAKEDPVEVFASYWLAAVCKLHKEWRELCARDPDANLSCSFNRVYEYVGVAVESALATVKSDRLKVLAEVNARPLVLVELSLLDQRTDTNYSVTSGMERRCIRSEASLLSHQGFSTESPSEDVSMAVPEMIHSAEVYQLYRGACGKEGDLVAEKCRIWVPGRGDGGTNVGVMPLCSVPLCCTGAKVDFPNLRIAIAEYDQQLASQIGLALQKLLKSRDEEGRGRLYFIQRKAPEMHRRRVLACLVAEPGVKHPEDFSKMDIVSALRQLFDTFKPGGEGQVITRILEYFAESYFQQWQVDPKAVEPVTAYASADTVFQDTNVELRF
ncbi:Sodium channel protein type 11 subunit alpha [Durusdinium trenchii]|uniref:Sodium channel protein type 11 subunit alpha n=1 Tax=Durusdinium trenchii TaxID=1381693 RepID=A0ABP0R4Y2_9DINO